MVLKTYLQPVTSIVVGNIMENRLMICFLDSFTEVYVCLQHIVFLYFSYTSSWLSSYSAPYLARM